MQRLTSIICSSVCCVLEVGQLWYLELGRKRFSFGRLNEKNRGDIGKSVYLFLTYWSCQGKQFLSVHLCFLKLTLIVVMIAGLPSPFHLWYHRVSSFGLHTLTPPLSSSKSGWRSTCAKSCGPCLPVSMTSTWRCPSSSLSCGWSSMTVVSVCCLVALVEFVMTQRQILRCYFVEVCEKNRNWADKDALKWKIDMRGVTWSVGDYELCGAK